MTRRFDDVAHDTPLRAYAACLALALVLVCGRPAAASATIPLGKAQACPVG
jgi:hypothetical protein